MDLFFFILSFKYLVFPFLQKTYMYIRVGMFVCVSMLGRDVPRGPVIKTLPSDAGSAGSIPGRGTKILHVS